jgi:hypothetical protein
MIPEIWTDKQAKVMNIELYLELEDAAGIYKIDMVDMGRLHNERLHKNIEKNGVEFYRLS